MPGLDFPASSGRHMAAPEEYSRVDVAQELAALRGEIAALRADLAPPASSAILIGPQVLDEFRHLMTTTAKEQQ